MRKLFTLILTLVSVTILSGCGERWSWHQKLTVSVKTPNGVVSGSSVARVTWGEVNSVHNYPASYSGEATVINLGDRYLFALLQEDTKYLGLRTFLTGGVGEELFAKMSKIRGTKRVKQEHYPLLVTFDDINDPTSVKEVDPENLAATFDPGYSLQSIMLEITDNPVTEGEVEKVLGWLNDYKQKQYRLNGAKCVACPVSSENLSDLLSGSNFKIGTKS